MAVAGRAIVPFEGDYSKLTSGLASALAPAKMGKFGKGAGLAVGAAFVGGMAAAGIAKAAYDLGAEYDKAFDKIRVGTGKTGKSLEKLKGDFKSVYGNVSEGMDEVATAITGVRVSLDLTGKPLREMSQRMVQLSTLTNSDLEGNIRSVARAFQDWDVPVRDQTKTLDAFFRLSQAGGGTVSDLADSVQKFGSPLRTLGFDLADAASMFASFEKAGVNTQTMVPGLKFAIANMSAPTADLAEKLKQLGVNANDPKDGLQKLFAAIGNKSDLSKIDKMNLAMDVFGRRAGADMKEAIHQGRFNVKSFMDVFKDGQDTIPQAAADTRDFSENAKILGHRLQNIVEPAASDLFDTLGDLSGALVDLTKQSKKGGGGVDGFFSRLAAKGQDAAAAAGILKAAYKAMGPVWDFVKRKTEAAIQGLKGVWKIVRGFTKVLAIFKGDWRQALWGIADITTGAVKVVTAKVKSMVGATLGPTKLIAKGLKAVFGGAWDSVEGIFVDGGNAVIDVINQVIEAINSIPGLPDIGHVGRIGGGGPKTPAQKAFKTFQRGSYITGGKPSGDSVPALLERGEYVLNREAVKKVGVQNLDHLNFKKAARFQTGGPIGMIDGGSITGAVSDAANAVAGAASNVLHPVDWFLNKLPKPNIPEPFTGVGPYVVDKAKDYIKDKVGDLIASSGNAASYPGLPGGAGMFQGTPVASWIVPILTWAQNHGWGGSITSGVRSAAHNATIPGASPTSNHLATAYPGGAIDVGGFTSQAEGQALASVLANYPRRPTLVWGGPVMNDWGHFSATGHQKGGLIGRIARMMVGGAAEHGVVKRVGADLLSHGFDFKSTAGILGNAWREGLWNPAQMEMTGADNGGLWGFTAYEKSLANLRAYAESKGKRWDDPIVQTHFMMKTGGNGIKGALNALDSIPETTKTFMDEYEIPASATAALDIRTSAAFDAAKILRDAGITKPGDEAGGDSAADERRDAAKGRKSKRKDILSRLQASLKGKVGGARLGTLWDIVGAYAKYGKFEGSEKSMLLGQAGSAARAKSPVTASKTLDRLRLMLGDLVEVSGENGTNENLFDRLKNIKAKGSAIASDKRDRIFAKIRKNGRRYPFKEQMFGVDGHIAQLAEQLDIAEQFASFEGGPGGSELTEAERVKQVYLNRQILGEQTKKSGWLNKAIAVLYGKETGLSNQVAAATPKGSKTHWKLSALKKAMKETRGGINELGGYRETLVGVTGQGGELFDTQMRLKNLGAASTVESASAAARDAELVDLMREQLGLANRNNAILAAQTPIYEQFLPKYHTGGIIPPGGEQPIMAKGGEGVFTRDQMAAMGGGSPTVVIEIAEGAGVDPAMIDARINGQLVNAVRKTRTGGPAAGRKYVTNG